MRCIEFIPVVVVNGTVQLVASGPGNHIHGSTCVSSCLRTVLRLRRELNHRIDGEHDTGDPGNTTLVHRGDVVPEIVVIYSVDLPVDLIGARAIQGAETANVVATKARLHRNQLCKVAPVERSVLHYVIRNRRRLSLRCRVERNGSRVNFHRCR